MAVVQLMLQILDHALKLPILVFAFTQFPIRSSQLLLQLVKGRQLYVGMGVGKRGKGLVIRGWRLW